MEISTTMNRKTMSNNISKVTVLKKGKKHLNSARTIPEVFDIVRDAETQEEKVALLQAYNSKGMRYIVNGLYNVDWSDMQVPKVKLSHRPPEVCNAGINTILTRLESAYKYRLMKPEVTHRNLVRILEEVSKREAELLLDMFKGKKVEGISKAVFKRAYPEFFRSEQETPTV